MLEKGESEVTAALIRKDLTMYPYMASEARIFTRSLLYLLWETESVWLSDAIVSDTTGPIMQSVYQECLVKYPLRISSSYQNFGFIKLFRLGAG